MNREFILRDGEIAFNRPDGTVVIMNIDTYLNLKKREKEPKEDNVEVYLNQIAALQKALIKEKAQHEDCVAEYDQTLASMSSEILALRERHKKAVNDLYIQTGDLHKQLDEEKQAKAAYVKAYDEVVQARNKTIEKYLSLEEKYKVLLQSYKTVSVQLAGMTNKAEVQQEKIKDLEKKVNDLKNGAIPKRPLGYMTADGVIIADTIAPRGGLYVTSTGKLISVRKQSKNSRTFLLELSAASSAAGRILSATVKVMS